MFRETNESYSAIEHLAKALYFNDWRNVQLVMGTVYGDASGSEHDQIAQIVAGFYTSADNWNDFAKGWKAFLDRHGIPALHMTDFIHDKEPYAKFAGKQHLKDALLDDALDEIERSGATSFVNVVVSDDFNDYAKAHKADGFTFKNAYIFMASAFVSNITEWCGLQRRRDPDEYILEAGDPKQGVLRTIMKNFGLPEPIFRKKTDPDDPRRSILPLQACDFLAYEILEGLRRSKDGREPRRWLTRFERSTNKYWAHYSRENMEGFPNVAKATAHLKALIASLDDGGAAI